ncbi:GNAT family N-acetyltransferase [Proteiniborus sp. MB09-C3]|uniref:GNAT family N-acetyltransferase n=1 Tax=Proteiniborus sp. MB09-C3 TaxID=3050072 RepID=UPI002552DF7B|nr:GNAT family N-acetyltransferase [Proteiniborus sp. MB09-C3]WIV12686.1 GNAT family N-acetyltransferase [Proteiniborus sp. MB09-C3]
MITYKRCTEVNEDIIFQAFKTGFSDYIIKIEISKEFFIKRFFGPEGNSLKHSVIALDGDMPVGLNLGGIKVYEGIKTLRCGALCIHPDYRGTEVGKQLFELHRVIALENSCKQMFLEVIVGNDRAINFYKKKGYEKVYGIAYYSHSNPSEIKAALPNSLRVEKVDMNILRTLGHEIQDIHINWQNDFDYISQIDGQVHYGVFKDEKLIGGLSIHPKGKISFLWINPEIRYHGIGQGIINYAVKELNIEKLAINFSNNASLFGFVKHLNFAKDAISQYEMYHIL